MPGRRGLLDRLYALLDSNGWPFWLMLALLYIGCGAYLATTKLTPPDLTAVAAPAR